MILCWGLNNNGQLADGGNSNSFRPVLVLDSASQPATQISAGGEHVCAVLREGALECWGANGVGELATGTPDVTIDFGAGFRVYAATARVARLAGAGQVSASGDHVRRPAGR